MKRFTVLFAFFVFFGVTLLQAQTVQISGVVTSGEDGLPLPGVSVVVSGTTIGTTTDINGTYQLAVPQNAKSLVFRFVGMKTLTIPIEGKTEIKCVTLSADVVGLDELIVVGYATTRREANTGSVNVKVKNEQLADIPESSFDKMLTGKAPAGVMVTSNTGQPGGNTQIRIRGTSSINAGADPLYVVDGIPVMEGDQTYFTNTGNALTSLNPNDIESITILKDLAAASIYGSRAANGVILITTKSGNSVKPMFISALLRVFLSWQTTIILVP